MLTTLSDNSAYASDFTPSTIQEKSIPSLRGAAPLWACLFLFCEEILPSSWTFIQALQSKFRKKLFIFTYDQHSLQQACAAPTDKTIARQDRMCGFVSRLLLVWAGKVALERVTDLHLQANCLSFGRASFPISLCTVNPNGNIPWFQREEQYCFRIFVCTGWSWREDHGPRRSDCIYYAKGTDVQAFHTHTKPRSYRLVVSQACANEYKLFFFYAIWAEFIISCSGYNAE